MTSQREKAAAFQKLHEGPKLLVLPNAWDVASAKVIAAAGARAIATSSAGIATALGFPDGQRISRAEMLDMVRRIAAALELPVSADVEAGYGETPEAAALTARGVLEAGAVGMNLEDAASAGQLLPLDLQVARLRAARAAAEAFGVPLVINGRTDVFAARDIQGDARVEEAVRRANAYLAAGADCAFVPFVTDRDVIARLARGVRGPLNVLGVFGSPPLADLERVGVRRVSVGSAVARAAYATARRIAKDLLTSGSYEGMRDAIPFAEMQELLAP
jgi:2-methylisocitrate lyase-like PEP mutase family enzyme